MLMRSSLFNLTCRALGRALAHFLTRPNPKFVPFATIDPIRLRAAINPCDVLLVEGNTRFSTAIKFLTQSTWSHAAFYVGECPEAGWRIGDEPLLIEADVVHGVISVPLSKYNTFHTRICRATSLSADDKRSAISYATSRMGHKYDLKNVFDLARYLFPTPPIPIHWRRRALNFGSGDPTRAICSTLIAQIFQSIRYPILPNVTKQQRAGTTPQTCNTCIDEVWRIRHHSLFAPRDFDLSPYFAVIKASVDVGFDHRNINWALFDDSRAN